MNVTVSGLSKKLADLMNPDELCFCPQWWIHSSGDITVSGKSSSRHSIPSLEPLGQDIFPSVYALPKHRAGLFHGHKREEAAHQDPTPLRKETAHQVPTLRMADTALQATTPWREEAVHPVCAMLSFPRAVLPMSSSP